MAIGYEGYAALNGEIFLATASSAPKVRNKIESTSGYAANTASVSGGNIGVGFPHAYDFVSYDGSLSYEANEAILADQIKSWLFSRSTSREIAYQPRQGGAVQVLPETYWTTISIETSAQSAVTGTIDYVSWIKQGGGPDYNTVTDNYIANRDGAVSSFFTELELGGNLQALGGNVAPIPYWRTSLSGFTGTGLVQPLSWTVSFSQDVNKVFLCAVNENPVAPPILTIGPMRGTLTVELMVVDGSYTASESIAASIGVGLTGIGLGTCQQVNFADDLKDKNSNTSINLEFDVYGPLS